VGNILCASLELEILSLRASFVWRWLKFGAALDRKAVLCLDKGAEFTKGKEH
jgi:hypothetical protein